MDTRLVCTHTPDRCWVYNGWNCLSYENRKPIAVDGVPGILPVQSRVFSVNGQKITALFWLMVNGQLYNYGEGIYTRPRFSEFIADFFNTMLRGRPEHYFVRISSNLPENRLLAEPLMHDVMAALAPTGVIAPAPVTPPGK
jgi:hypothetical protein